ncbi:MAG: NTP transferase domain-containing protein, partial [Firmicutes bacterium]|nr:NTP transferase domain-containing protein [Bacillota bacterium]
RFWPLSCRARPKQFLRLFGERTMLQETLHRVRHLAPAQDVYVVAGREHAGLVREQLPEVPPENVLAEPCGRDTAAAVGLAALHVARRDPEAVMAVLPADHYIADPEGFAETLLAAAELAASGRWLVTLGVTPTRPETGYGYIERGEAIGEVRGRPAYRAARFTEKPDYERACAFLARGGYLWNSGMFVWRADVVLEGIRRHLPELAPGLEAVAGALGTPSQDAVLERVYPVLSRVSVDYGIMERADNVAVVPLEAGWDDVGSWPAWARHNPCDGRGNVLQGRGVLLDTEGCIVRAPGRVVATLGVRDLIIVEEDGRLLVCARERAQELKRLVAALKEAGYGDAV